MRSRFSGLFNKLNVAWNDVNGLLGSLEFILYSTVTLATFPQPEAPQNFTPRLKSKHITFYKIKILKCIGYKNYSKKLCDYDLLVCLTN